MRSVMAAIAVLLLLVGSAPVFAGQTERDIVDRFLARAQKKHTHHLSWVAGNFGMNRINRQNDYNAFASYQSSNFSNGSLEWLGEAKSFGLDFGLVFAQKIGLSIGGEYWLKVGENKSGSFYYTPIGDSVTNLKSEIQVWGVTTGLQYYVFNRPTVTEQLTNPAVRIGGSVGYYQASWELWPEYQNLNLATSTPEATNIAFKGSAPGFMVNIGGDYPIQWNGMVIGADIGYMMLNFKNVSWYNSQDQEVVATVDGTSDGRVNLDLSGVKGRIEVKRFFSW